MPKMKDRPNAIIILPLLFYYYWKKEKKKKTARVPVNQTKTIRNTYTYVITLLPYMCAMLHFLLRLLACMELMLLEKNKKKKLINPSIHSTKSIMIDTVLLLLHSIILLSFSILYTYHVQRRWRAGGPFSSHRQSKCKWSNPYFCTTVCNIQPVKHVCTTKYDILSLSDRRDFPPVFIMRWTVRPRGTRRMCLFFLWCP